MVKHVFSIPIHERTEVVIDLILNIRRFSPGNAIVFHVSRGFDWARSLHSREEFLSILKTFDNVFVNPTSLDTRWGDIVHTHVANFKYITSVLDFEFFTMASSNELFVRNLPLAPPKGFDAAFIERIWIKIQWWKEPNDDTYLHRMLEHFGVSKSSILISQVEGTFYRREFFAEIVAALDQFYSIDTIVGEKRAIYPREETYFPTIAALLAKGQKHLRSLFTFVPWNRQGFTPTMPEVQAVAAGDMLGKYSVKRVRRLIDDPTRIYIGSKLGGYRDRTLSYIDRF